MILPPQSSINIKEVLESASLQEKLSLLSGYDFWHTKTLPEYRIPAITFTDGPNGVRGTKFFNPVPSVCIPCGTGLGATWNVELIEQAGRMLSKACTAKGAHVWLGPTVNIARSPLNGRGFECLSEDPHLSGMLAAAMIRGIQSRGTLAAIKHFAANEQETEKFTLDVCMSQRALREIYLMPFQIALRDSDPRVFMTSYNKLNGTYTSENKSLIQGIVRDEWGFDGLVVSDWFGTYSGPATLNAGLDLEMPGPARHRKAEEISGEVTNETINARVRKLLQFVSEASLAPVDKEDTSSNNAEDRELNRRLASESVVLLKNSANHLPIEADDCHEVALIGPNINLDAACGGGSAKLRAHYTSSVYQGIKASLPADAIIHHELGVYHHDLLPVLSDELSATNNREGEPKVSIQFFHEPYQLGADRTAFDFATIPDTSYQLMDYSHPDLLQGQEFYVSMTAQYEPQESGLYEFGLASYGISDLYLDDELIIDNSTQQDYGGMFFSKGSVERRGVCELKAGRTYCLRVEAGSAATSRIEHQSKLKLPGGACRLGTSMKIEVGEGIRRAVALAKTCKHTFVVAGLHADLEKEGKDRASMDLPPGVDDLINAVLSENPDAVIITQAGHPVTMPWRHRAKTLLHSFYGGSEAGNAVANVVFGRVNPSGRLPITFPDRLEDSSSYLSFGSSDNGRLFYSDDIYVGYRYFEAKRQQPAFPFCHGLSYTSFALSNMHLDTSSVQVDLRNTGFCAGSEVVALYLSYLSTNGSRSRFARPPRVLVGFRKQEVRPGESARISLPIDKYSTAVWDEKMAAWCCEKGTYVVSVCAGSASLQQTLILESDMFWKGL